MDRTTAVVIVGHAVYRRALVEFVARRCGLKVVGTASTLRAGLAAVREEKPFFAITDLSISPADFGAPPTVEMLQHLRAIARLCPPPRTIVLGHGHLQHEQLMSAEAHVQCYLGMDESVDLRQAVAQAQAGEAYLAGADLAALLNSMAQLPLTTFLPADPRVVLDAEMNAILGWLTAGDSYAAMAKRLFLSRRSVSTRVSRLYRLLGVSHRWALPLGATRTGLPLPSPNPLVIEEGETTMDNEAADTSSQLSSGPLVPQSVTSLRELLQGLRPRDRNAVACMRISATDRQCEAVLGFLDLRAIGDGERGAIPLKWSGAVTVDCATPVAIQLRALHEFRVFGEIEVIGDFRQYRANDGGGAGRWFVRFHMRRRQQRDWLAKLAAAEKRARDDAPAGDPGPN